mmetsp:Transcript_27072/g.37690  ORF Transcript_27072/g.37690 Transcript_27072/m.37690 type:complete len:85 (-) Transcript_27072:598-852(-)
MVFEMLNDLSPYQTRASGGSTPRARVPRLVASKTYSIYFFFCVMVAPFNFISSTVLEGSFNIDLGGNPDTKSNGPISGVRLKTC